MVSLISWPNACLINLLPHVNTDWGKTGPFQTQNAINDQGKLCPIQEAFIVFFFFFLQYFMKYKRPGWFNCDTEHLYCLSVTCVPAYRVSLSCNFLSRVTLCLLQTLLLKQMWLVSFPIHQYCSFFARLMSHMSCGGGRR